MIQTEGSQRKPVETGSGKEYDLQELQTDLYNAIAQLCDEQILPMKHEYKKKDFFWYKLQAATITLKDELTSFKGKKKHIPSGPSTSYCEIFDGTNEIILAYNSENRKASILSIGKLESDTFVFDETSPPLVKFSVVEQVLENIARKEYA